MWQSTISLRYVSYKNADSNLHERICAMAMMAKNLLWSCAQIVAPRPPINPQRPNHRRQRSPGVRPVCILRQWRGAAAADRSPEMRAERAKLKSWRDDMKVAQGKRGTSAALGK